MFPMSFSTFVPTTPIWAADTCVGEVVVEQGPDRDGFLSPLVALLLIEQFDCWPPTTVCASDCGGDSCWMQPARVVVIEPVDEDDDVEEDEWDSMCMG